MREAIIVDQLITKNLIILDMEESSKEQAICRLSKAIEAEGKLIDYKKYVEQVFEREKTFPTAIGFEFAIPHGKTDAVKTAAVAFGRLKNHLAWGEDEKVKYIFLIAVPEKEAGDRHLQILAQLSRKIMRDEFREEIKNCSDVDEILKLLS